MKLATAMALGAGGLLAVTALSSPAFAQDDFYGLNLTINTGHSAAPPGDPLYFPTSPSSSYGGGGPITIYNLEPQNSGGQEVIGLAGTNPPVPGNVMITGTRFDTFSTFTTATIFDHIDSNGTSNFGGFDYIDDCFLAPINLAAPSGTVVQFCDSLDASINLGDLTLNLQSVENDTDMFFEIPQLNFQFTTANARDRGGAWNTFENQLQMQNLLDPVASLLAGRAVNDPLPAGLLPNHEGFIEFEATVLTANGGNPPESLSGGFAGIGEVLGFAIVNRDSDLATFGFDYVDDCFRFIPTGPVNEACDPIGGSLSVFGVAVNFTGATDSPDLTFAIPSIGYNYTTTGALDRTDAIHLAVDNLKFSGKDEALKTELYAALMSDNAQDAVVGNPASLQGTFITQSLNLASYSSLDFAPVSDLAGPGLMVQSGGASAESGAATSDSDSDDDNGGGGGRRGADTGWMIGARIGTYNAGTTDATFIEGAAERSFRIVEGSRARLKVSIPFSFLNVNGMDPQTSAAIRLGYEVPVVPNRWVVEPFVGAGYAFETNNLSAGALYSLGVSSRYKIAPVGRGHIIIGNAVSYSSTIEIDTGPITTPVIQNTTFRNGIAYQVPVGQRIFDRLGAVRVSYTHTSVQGDPVFLDEYHDVSLSYGVYARESSVRQRAELFRFGLTGTYGTDFNATSLVLGYSF